MESDIRIFRAATAAGVLVLIVGVALLFIYPPYLETLPPGFSTPILALEFVTSLVDAQALVGNDPEVVAQMQTGHWVDMGFLCVYGALLALTNLGFWKRLRRPLSLVGVFAALIASSADLAENINLLQLGEALQGLSAPPDFWLLRLYVATKFLGISAALLCLALPLWQQGRIGKAFALVSFLLVPMTVVGLSGPPVLAEAMGSLIALDWILLLVWLLRRGKNTDTVPLQSGLSH
ncbi:MAG TPA: hypothetical protein VM553_07125 [Dongiaceae bacterium]|nr:hypothetical protein [Dongiaceae bacterium]